VQTVNSRRPKPPTPQPETSESAFFTHGISLEDMSLTGTVDHVNSDEEDVPPMPMPKPKPKPPRAGNTVRFGGPDQVVGSQASAGDLAPSRAAPPGEEEEEEEDAAEAGPRPADAGSRGEGEGTRVQPPAALQGESSSFSGDGGESGPPHAPQESSQLKTSSKPPQARRPRRVTGTGPYDLSENENGGMDLTGVV
jgi:hypothetical protein